METTWKVLEVVGMVYMLGFLVMLTTAIAIYVIHDQKYKSDMTQGEEMEDLAMKIGVKSPLWFITGPQMINAAIKGKKSPHGN